MDHHEKADHMTSISARRARRRHPVRLLALLGVSGMAAVLVPISDDGGEPRGRRADRGLALQDQPRGHGRQPDVELRADGA